MLVDAGPLVAIIDADDTGHERCHAVLRQIPPGLLTTWPAITEAMYLLGRNVGWPGQQKLWQMLLSDELRIDEIAPAGLQRCAELMHKYGDLPMDLADATLVTVAEARSLRQIFTLDDDFDVYRVHGRQRFQRLPS